MRTLIDGYNLLHAVIDPTRTRARDALRRSRQRFLNDLADLLGAVEAHQTTVIFDAAAPPDHLPREVRHKGLTVVFAADDESADACLERLIARDPKPRTLAVVSSDLRVRRAAERRGAKAITADAYWSKLRERRESPRHVVDPPRLTPEEIARQRGLDPDEAAYWEREFRHVIDSPEARSAFADASPMLSDDDIRRIAREIEREDW